MVGGEVGGAHNAPPGRFVIPDSLAVTSVRIATITRKKRSRNLANAKRRGLFSAEYKIYCLVGRLH